ncbi:phage GP46 family protein [Undibacterium sp. SXout20W]|uniref:phage GP46 family protein n=1 Tax=Undibacterium sp. SXout20W TaxID=3413051 RepID=UPI003BF00F10
MSDTTIIWNPALGYGDWAIKGSQLRTGNDLQTAIYISLFTDRAANPDDIIPDGSNDPRGWWGDAGQDVIIGSRLWLLSRSKQATETLNQAKDYISEALQWLIDDGVVGRFDITVEWTKASMLGANVVAYSNGSQSAMQFFWTWNGGN